MQRTLWSTNWPHLCSSTMSPDDVMWYVLPKSPVTLDLTRRASSRASMNRLTDKTCGEMILLAPVSYYRSSDVCSRAAVCLRRRRPDKINVALLLLLMSVSRAAATCITYHVHSWARFGSMWLRSFRRLRLLEAYRTWMPDLAAVIPNFGYSCLAHRKIMALDPGGQLKTNQTRWHESHTLCNAAGWFTLLSDRMIWIWSGRVVSVCDSMYQYIRYQATQK